MKGLVFAAVAAVLLHVAVAATVWPKPLSQTDGSSTFVLDRATFSFTAAGQSSDILDDAFERYLGIIFQSVSPSSSTVSIANSSRVRATPLTSAVVNVLTSDTSLTLETNESYTLNVGGANDNAAPSITVTAQTVFGALRGLETLSQLVEGNLINETVIADQPRFQFRAFMIDTARHWYPISVILQHLDAMAYSKFNVLHWHIVDSDAFPYESHKFPSLSQTGAYSQTHIYTRDSIQHVIDYAYNRGIRVIPEFDTPGHVQAGYASIPNLLTPCYSGPNPDGSTGPLNPTLNSTYDFLTDFYAEVKDVFKDKFVHVGGDEVSFDCWEHNPDIQKWMAAHPEIKDYAGLEAYYEIQLLEILKKQDTSYICWEEIFDNGVPILPDTVVDVWKGGWNKTMAAVTKAGYHSVLSAPFYINYISYGEDWPKYYSVEPTDFDGDEAQKEKLVGGVETCMWSEYVDSTNFIARSWPRAAAVGERGWSAKSVTDVNAARPRLQEFRCKLIARGINAEPTGPTTFCAQEWAAPYEPPFNPPQLD